nr:class I SAM-dependent methyltransferase [Aliarcobacter butzleri]
MYCAKKYKKDELNEAIIGEIPPFYIVVENGLKYKINFFNKNIGIFLDMKIGREYISSICNDKNVLNLFSYTCAFSVVAINAKAKQVVNVDMAKGALTTGRENHHLNNLETKKVKFMPYDILKSWNRIKKEGPYDIIIIDPPSFQKGSFAATKDYEKIIKKLPELASKNCIVLSCLNAPELDSDFIKQKFEEFAPTFKFEKRLENLKEFITNNEEKSLKSLIFFIV